MYLQIKNPGVCDIELLTTFGISTSRGNSNMIGQFGSGAKHGILTMMRMGINPIIYCGKKRVQFWSEPAQLSTGHTYNKIFVQIDNDNKKELSVALEYGAIDWNNIEMALREFVSNAIDATTNTENNVSIKIIDNVEVDDNSTIIAVPLTPEVQRFYSEIYTRFLQFNVDYDADQKILDKKTNDFAKIYRKGVFVRELSKMKPSLFNYNFGEEISIDESRNMSDFTCQYQICEEIARNKEALKKIFVELNKGDKEWLETQLGGTYNLEWNAKNRDAKLWQQAWLEVFGDKAVVVHYGNKNVCDRLLSKGYIPIYVSNASWYSCIMAAKIPSVATVLEEINTDGDEIIDATFETLTTFNKIWLKLKNLKLTQRKNEPEVKCFIPRIEAGNSIKQGYVKDDTIYISKNHSNNYGVILEEVSHYISGFDDCTREFQSFAFQVAAELMETSDV